jgi:hypothetical protein
MKNHYQVSTVELLILYAERPPLVTLPNTVLYVQKYIAPVYLLQWNL